HGEAEPDPRDRRRNPRTEKPAPGRHAGENRRGTPGGKPAADGDRGPAAANRHAGTPDQSDRDGDPVEGWRKGTPAPKVVRGRRAEIRRPPTRRNLRRLR